MLVAQFETPHFFCLQLQYVYRFKVTHNTQVNCGIGLTWSKFGVIVRLQHDGKYNKDASERKFNF